MAACIPVGPVGGTAVLLVVLSTIGCNPAAQPTQADKEEEYVKQKASAVLDALLVGDAPGVQGAMTVTLQKRINPTDNGVSLNNWVVQWNSRKLYKSYTIDKVAFSPSKDEVVLSGTLTGKDEAVKGKFSMTLVKEKDKYLFDACTVKEQ
jgi:hypothetical protein